MSKIKLFIGILAGILIAGIAWYYWFIQSSVEVTVTTTNITEFTIIDNGNKALFTESTSRVRVSKNSVFTVEYTADEGFASGSKQVPVFEEPFELPITAHYSQNRLNSLLKNSEKDIKQAVLTGLLNTDDYVIDNVKLYHSGDWASVRFLWKGGYSSNSDDLIVVLHEENGSWEISAGPSIVLSTVEYPDIPEDILRDVNTSFL